jgi:glycosyltransferase involved in cell wall biosynthesis
VLVGDGPDRGELEARLGPLAAHALLVGARPLAEVPVWMAAADVVTLPSHHEGTPNVLLEALSCGRRVVATRVGGIPDVVHRGELGVLVEVGAIEALAAALTEVATTPYDAGAVAALGARGGWDESAARLHQTLLAAAGLQAGTEVPREAARHVA